MSNKKAIIKDSSTIRDLLEKRIIAELGLSYTQVAIEAERFGQNNIKVETLSRYFKKVPKNALTEESIVFLCYRFGIPIRLTIGIPEKVENGKVMCSLPKYDEKSCIQQVKKLFKNDLQLQKSAV